MIRATKKPRSRPTGISVLRPLEFVAWLVLLLSLAGIALLSHATDLNTAPSASSNMRIDLNSATIEQLKSLPGMTTRRAQAIVHAREKNGRFKEVGDLLKIPGITSGYLKRIDEMVEARE